MSLVVRVRYFAALREALGAGEEVRLPDGADLAALRAQLIASSDGHAKALAPGRAVRCALNQVMSDEAAALKPGDEVAFFPPVTGG